MPDFKKIEQQSRIFEQIKKLDAEITEIEKYAMRIANDETFVLLTMRMATPKEDITITEVNGYGHTIDKEISQYFKLMYMPSAMAMQSPPKKDDTFDYEATNKEALLIFGIILQGRISRRDALIRKLEAL